MAELALDDVDRHPLACELDRVGVPELVGREPPPNARIGGEVAQLGARGGRGPRPPAGGPSITHNSGPTGNVTR